MSEQNGKRNGVARSLPDAISPDAVNDATPPAQETLWEYALRLLRRRAVFATALAVLLGVTFGLVGWKRGGKTFISDGQVYLPPLESDEGVTAAAAAEQNDPTYMKMQAEFVKSSRVLDRAMNSDGWKGLGKPFSQSQEKLFADAIAVQTVGRTITIQFTDGDPNVSVLGAQSVLDAYAQLSSEEEVEQAKTQLQFLESELAVSGNRLAELNDEIRSKFAQYHDLAQYDVNDLEQLFADRLQRVSQLKNTIASQDPQMAALLDKQNAIQDSLQDLRSRGFLANDPKIKETQSALAIINRDIDALAEQRRQQAASVDTTQPSSSNVAQQLKDASAQAAIDLDEITRLKRDVRPLQDQIAEEKLNHDDLNRRYIALERISRLPGRVQIIEPANQPPGPVSDSRPMHAIAGVISGVCFGLAGVLTVGLLDPRVREPEDVRHGTLRRRPILGMLPDLPSTGADTEQSTRAAECVHHIRTSLQLWYGWISRPVLCITGPDAGAGKTTLTMALGLSYAAANSRTLLIDFDFVGSGLTRRIGMVRRERLGQILRQQANVKPSQVREAVQVASASDLKLGEALVQLGHVQEQELQAALSRQQETSLGVLDALSGKPLAQCVVKTGVANLSLLGLGGARAQDSGRISPVEIQGLLDSAREKYDVVLIDTGPVPGSPLSAAVAAAADGIVIAVARGDLRRRLRKCVQHLQAMGGQLAGVVFNRAGPKDLAEVGSGSQSKPGRDQSESTVADADPHDRFGPFGMAVALPARNGNGTSSHR